MKNNMFISMVIVAFVALAWLVWFAPAGQEEPVPEVMTEVPVNVDTAKLMSLRNYVMAYGTVEPAPATKDHQAASALLSPAVPGTVVNVNIVRGQHVNANDVILELDSRAADLTLGLAEKNIQRQRLLLEGGGSSERALQEAEQQLDSARVQRSLLTIISPLAGTVTQVNVKPGETVDLGTTMTEIIDFDQLVISARVPVTEASALKPGQPGEIVTMASNHSETGTITYIDDKVDNSNDTVLVQVSVPANSGFRPGQFASLRIISEEHVNCLAVPIESLVKDEEGDVIAIVEDGTAHQKQVMVGIRENGWVEVEAQGLAEGMIVVTKGAYALPSDTKVRLINN